LTFDLDGLLAKSEGWHELQSAADSGSLPQSVFAQLPAELHKIFVERYAELFLGPSASEDYYTHPDLIYAGTAETPPSIDECRALNGELSLHPLAAERRLAVIWSADRLSVEASNSLLKITEEPPMNGSILLIAAEDNLIPTLKSRVWSVSLEAPEELVKGEAPPSSLADWAYWMDNRQKKSADIIFLEVGKWIKYFTDNGDFKSAADLETFVRVAEKRRLSVPMVQDSLFAILKEGIPCGQIFGDIW
jgi:DNA polymerase-3 subunit delta'